MGNFRFTVLVLLFAVAAKINDAEPQNPEANQEELIPRMLPDLGPRISLEDLLFSDYLGGSPAGIISISGSLSDLADGLLGGLHSGSLGNLHGGSLGNLQGGSMGNLFGPQGQFGPQRPPQGPQRPPQGHSQRPSQGHSQRPSQGMSQQPAHLPTPEDGCGISPVRKSRIVGGVPAKNGAYPWMALLGYRVGGNRVSFNCGGSLITTRHVLSAAHCMNPTLYMVRLGEHDLTTDRDGQHEDVRVTRGDAHEVYNKELGINDIAIVYLTRDVQYTDRVRPICLPITGPVQRQSFVDSTPFVAGWGTTKEKGEQARVLMEVQVPVISNEDCKDKYERIGQYKGAVQFSDRVLCAGYRQGGKDSCQGDSGGPLMLPLRENGKFPFYQIGVVSYGAGCARVNIPGVYANVQHYADWIKNKIRQ